MNLKFSVSAFWQIITFAFFLSAFLGYSVLPDFEKQAAVIIIGEMAAIMLAGALLVQVKAQKSSSSNPVARIIASRGKSGLTFIFLFDLFWFGSISYAITKSVIPAAYFAFSSGLKFLDFKFSKAFRISLRYFAVSFALMWTTLFFGVIFEQTVCKTACSNLNYLLGLIYFGVLVILSLTVD